MDRLAERYGTAVLLALSAAVLLCSFLAPAGYVSIDELVYDLGARALALSGSLTTENGFGTYGSRDLVFLNMVEGPNGLVPQYPVGTALFGAPFFAVADVRGLIFLNALSAIALLFVTHALARALFGDKALALGAVLILACATYFADYAWAVWPHMPSALAVTLGLLLIWRAMEAEAPKDLRWSVLAGFVIGLGFLFRTDTLLIVPAFGAVVLLYAARPVQIGLAGLAGLIPALVVAGVANELKFGTWNPVSYGTTGGATNLARHAPALGLVMVGVLAMAGFRMVTWRASWRWPVLVSLAAVVAAAWFLVPQAQAFATRYAFGAWNLVGDMRLSPDNRPGIQPRGDGTVQFWGMPKKGLGQSLPWLGLALFAFLRPWGTGRRAYLMLLAALGIWTLPFFLLAWHGGLSANMRYFLPILPVLAILGARGLVDLAHLAEGQGRRLVVGAVVGIATVFAWIALGPAGYFGAHQVLSIYALLSFSAVLGIAALLRAAAPAAQAAAGAGLGMALVFGPVHDVTATWTYRETARATGEVLASIPEPSVIYGPPHYLAFQVGRDRGLIAQITGSGEPDRAFLEQALRAGYSVYMIEPWVLEMEERDFGLVQDGPPVGTDTALPLYPVTLR
ncbi:MAG: glycosyltransferase family 39 protein [Pseudomonadota bacterium]